MLQNRNPIHPIVSNRYFPCTLLFLILHHHSRFHHTVYSWSFFQHHMFLNTDPSLSMPTIDTGPGYRGVTVSLLLNTPHADSHVNVSHCLAHKLHHRSSILSTQTIQLQRSFTYSHFMVTLPYLQKKLE